MATLSPSFLASTPMVTLVGPKRNPFQPCAGLVPWLGLQLDDWQTLTGQQDVAVLAILQGFLLNVDQILSSFVRIINACRLSLVATSIDSVGNAELRAVRSKEIQQLSDKYPFIIDSCYNVWAQTLLRLSQ